MPTASHSIISHLFILFGVDYYLRRCDVAQLANAICGRCILVHSLLISQWLASGDTLLAEVQLLCATNVRSA